MVPNKTYRLEIRLSESEKERLRRNSLRTNLSMTNYLKNLIRGYVPKESPKLNTLRIFSELKAIGNNMNQIAHVANALDLVETDAYLKIVKALYQVIEEMEKDLYRGEKIKENGNDEIVEH